MVMGAIILYSNPLGYAIEPAGGADEGYSAYRQFQGLYTEGGTAGYIVLPN